MNAQEARQFIKRQFSQGNAWVKGDVIRYMTYKSASLEKFKAAVEAVGGEVQRDRNYQVRDSVVRQQYECEVLIPDWQDPQSEIERLAPSGLLTVTEAARRLGYSIAWVRRLCQQGRLEAVKVGRDWLVSEVAIGKYEPRRAGRPPSESHQ